MHFVTDSSRRMNPAHRKSKRSSTGKWRPISLRTCRSGVLRRDALPGLEANEATPGNPGAPPLKSESLGTLITRAFSILGLRDAISPAIRTGGAALL